MEAWGYTESNGKQHLIKNTSSNHALSTSILKLLTVLLNIVN